MPISFLFLKRDLEQDNGHFLVLVQRNSCILSVQIVHKVNGTEWQRRWCWKLQKVCILFSVQRVHCPEDCLQTKVVENCQYTIVPTRRRLKLFFRTISSVNQLSLYGIVAEMGEEIVPYPDRTGDPLWEDTQVLRSCQVWSRQTCLWMMILHIQNFFRKDIENELKRYHNKTDWANFVLMQDSWLQWQIYLNQKVGSKGTPKLGP